LPIKATAQPAFSFGGKTMKSAEAFIEALEQGLSPVDALYSLPDYEPHYIDRIPVEVYRAALRNGWRFFPVSPSAHFAVKHTQVLQATNNLRQLKRWAQQRANWALATGPNSGVFVFKVDGGEGLTSLLDLCGDDWSWLDTLRSMAGEKRFIFFAWPAGRKQVSNRQQIGEHLCVLGEGDCLLVPPSRELDGPQHTYLNPQAAVVAAPAWLLDRVFEPADTVDPSRPIPLRSAGRDTCSNAVAAEAAHD
jgi:hypothetical protein